MEWIGFIYFDLKGSKCASLKGKVENTMESQ